MNINFGWKKTTTLLLLTCCMLLAACSNSNEPTEKNFQRAIKKELKQSNGDGQAYLPVKLGPYFGVHNKGGPFVQALVHEELIRPIVEQKHKSASTLTAAYHQLRLPVLNYQPTDLGQPFFTKRCGLFGFCADLIRIGDPVLVSIDHFTKPVVNNGKAHSEVTYSYYIKTYSWFNTVMAKLKDGDDSQVKQEILQRKLGSKTEPLTETVTLYQTKEGWVVNDDEEE